MKLYGNMNFEVNPDNVESYILYFYIISKYFITFYILNRVFCAFNAILQSLLQFNKNKDILQSYDVTQK